MLASAVKAVPTMSEVSFEEFAAGVSTRRQSISSDVGGGWTPAVARMEATGRVSDAHLDPCDLSNAGLLRTLEEKQRKAYAEMRAIERKYGGGRWDVDDDDSVSEPMDIGRAAHFKPPHATSIFGSDDGSSFHSLGTLRFLACRCAAHDARPRHEAPG